MSPDDQDAIRSRQQKNARVMAFLLFLFVALVFGISIAKMTINQ